MRLSKLLWLALNPVLAIVDDEEQTKLTIMRNLVVEFRNVKGNFAYPKFDTRIVRGHGRLTTANGYEYGWWLALGDLKICLWRDETLAEARDRMWNAYRQKQEQESASAN